MAIRPGQPAIREARRPVVCFRCGQVLGVVNAEWTQEGMARFRERAAALRRDHVCAAQDTRKLEMAEGSR